MEKAIGNKRGVAKRNPLRSSHLEFKKRYLAAGCPKFFSYTEENDGGEISSRSTSDRKVHFLRRRFDKIKRRQKR